VSPFEIILIGFNIGLLCYTYISLYFIFHLLRNSSVVFPTGVAIAFAKRAFTSLEFKALTRAVFSFWTIGLGVFAGAKVPHQAIGEKSWKPDSIKVGISANPPHHVLVCQSLMLSLVLF
jgi:hypothetical protein